MEELGVNHWVIIVILIWGFAGIRANQRGSINIQNVSIEMVELEVIGYFYLCPSAKADGNR